MLPEVITADSLDWLPKHRDLGSIITSLPDMDEIKQNKQDYVPWFKEAAKQCFLSASKIHPVIFYQTDRMLNGRRLSKLCLLMDVAAANEYELVWHKIVLRHDVGKIDLYRPGYSHMLCFGDERLKSGKPMPDVMYSGGFLYPYGMSINAAQMALQMALRYGLAVCDPFCGRGTVLAIANQLGFQKIIGVDIDPAQVAATLGFLNP